jgi:putative ABC transport system substrate-binding protein
VATPARAQQAGKLNRIGFLGCATAAGSAKAVESLRAGLREFGYVEGTNIAIEFRWAEGNYDRLPHLVADLIATNIDVLITHGTPGTRVAKQATTTIPIVMAISGDAIATGPRRAFITLLGGAAGYRLRGKGALCYRSMPIQKKKGRREFLGRTP